MKNKKFVNFMNLRKLHQYYTTSDGDFALNKRIRRLTGKGTKLIGKIDYLYCLFYILNMEATVFNGDGVDWKEIGID